MSPLDKLVADVLGQPESGIDDSTGPATNGDWSSLRHVQIVAAVAEQYDVCITGKEARAVGNVGDLRKLLAEKGRSA
jgi:acyl carrier protein